MTRTRDERIEDFAERCAYVIEMQSDDPELHPDLDHDVLQSAIGVAITNHNDTLTVFVEATTDSQGDAIITVSMIDDLGTPVTPTVMDAVESVMIVGRPS